MVMELKELGQRIKELRIAAGMNQEDLARIIQSSNTALSRIEAGRQNVGFKTLAAIAEALNVPLSELVKPR